MENNKIPGTVENWENGKLGRDERFVKVHPVSTDLVNKTLDTQNEPSEIYPDADEQRYRLALDPDHAKVIDAAAGMGEITIGLNKETVQYLNEKAKEKGINTKALIRNILSDNLKDV